MQSMSSTFNFVDNGDWLSKIANTGDLTWLLLVALLFIVIRICIYYMFSESENFVLARLSSLKCVKFINVHISKKFIAIVCSSITAAILISIVTLNIAKAADEEYENYNYKKLSCSLLSSDVYVDEQGVDRAEPIVLNNDNNIADVHIHSISLSSDNPEVLSSKWVIKFEGKEIFNDYPDSEVKFSTPIRIAANSSANFPVGLSMESSLASSLIGTHPVKIECSLMNAFQEDAFSLIDVKLSEFKKFIDSLQNIDDAEKERLYRELVESADDLRGVIAQLTGYEEIFDSLWKWYNKSFDKIKELTGTSIDNIKEDFFNQLSSFNNLPKDIIDDYIIRFNDFYDLFNGQLDDVDAVDSLIILINDFKDDVKSLLDEAKKNDNKSFWTVTFVSNGESETKSQSIKYGKCVQEPQVPTKFGYTFLGWYSSSDLKESTQWNFNVSTVGIDAGDKDLCILTLYGKWTKTTYQVTYFENGSTSGNVPDKQFKVHDEELILSSNTGNLRKNKNFFIGWNTESDGTGVHYDEGDSYNENKELNLYAHWQPTAYVEFNMMEHGTQVDRLEIPIGQKVRPVPSDPSDAGYNFKGWYKEKECLNLWNFDSDIVAADTTLYAKWEIKTYTVRYNANGSETGNNPESQTKYYGRSLQLHDDDDTLSKDGYALTGWNTSSDGKGTHYDLKGYYSDNKDILLYAEWTVSLTVTFDVRGHGTAPEPMHVAKGWKCKKPFPDPTDDAYQFVNWYKDDLYSTPWNFSTDIVTVNLTLYAKWELKVYEISYDSNDATGGSAPEVQFKNHGENLTLQNNSGGLYKTDFIFYGWNTDKNGTGTHYDEGDIYKENSSAVLFAEWATPHDVSFDLQGHGKADINPVTVAHGSKVEKPEDPTDDEGWTFRGWYKEPECINMWIFDEDKVISDVTLFALWTFNEYEVTIDTTYGFLEGDAPAGWNKTSDTTYVSYFAPDEPISSIIAPWLDLELKCSNIFIHVGWDKTSGLLEEDTVISAKWSGLAYQVCVWGIDEDDITGDKKYDKTVTFGPAVGSSANCLDVKGDHEGPCIHDMSWDDIIKDCNNGDTEKYRNCLNCGCTATVSLNINSSLGYMPDDEVYKFSTLYSGIIKDDFLKYNFTAEMYNDCSSARWDMSRMRATLNGREGMNLSRYAGSDCLYSNKCLLSCFPNNLQSAIKPRFSEIASSWRYDGSLDYHEVHTTVNDKLWLGEHSAFGSRGLNYSSGHGVYSKWFTSGRYIGSCYDHNNQYCRFWLLNVQMEFTFAIATWSDRIASMSNEVHGISPYFVLGTTSSN